MITLKTSTLLAYRCLTKFGWVLFDFFRCQIRRWRLLHPLRIHYLSFRSWTQDLSVAMLSDLAKECGSTCESRKWQTGCRLLYWSWNRTDCLALNGTFSKIQWKSFLNRPGTNATRWTKLKPQLTTCLKPTEKLITTVIVSAQIMALTYIYVMVPDTYYGHQVPCTSNHQVEDK